MITVKERRYKKMKYVFEFLEGLSLLVDAIIFLYIFACKLNYKEANNTVELLFVACCLLFVVFAYLKGKFN